MIKDRQTHLLCFISGDSVLFSFSSFGPRIMWVSLKQQQQKEMVISPLEPLALTTL